MYTPNTKEIFGWCDRVIIIMISNLLSPIFVKKKHQEKGEWMVTSDTNIAYSHALIHLKDSHFERSVIQLRMSQPWLICGSCALHCRSINLSDIIRQSITISCRKANMLLNLNILNCQQTQVQSSGSGVLRCLRWFYSHANAFYLISSCKKFKSLLLQGHWLSICI